MITYIKTFLKSHFFNKPDSLAIIVFYLAFVFLQCAVGLLANHFARIYNLISKINNNFLTVISILVPIVTAIITYLVKKAGQSIKNSHGSPMASRQSVRGYVGVVKNTELEKHYTLEELVNPQILPWQKGAPVFISDNIVDPASPTNERHSLIYHLEQQGLLIERAEHIKTMKQLIQNRFQDTGTSFKSIFLVGPSGSGKTILMQILKEKLQEYNVVYYPVSHYWSDVDFIKELDLLSENSSKKAVILIDQFETSLSSQLCDRSFWEASVLDRYPDIVFVFACTVHELGNTFMLLHTRESKTVIHYLTVDKEDAAELLHLKYTVDNQALCHILGETIQRVRMNKYPLVTLQIVGNLIEEGDVSFFDSRFAELESEIKDSPEKIVDLYFEQWLWLFEYPQFGASVLYLLSDGKPHSSGDIENIALLDAEKMHFSKDILSDTICSNKFIEMDYSGNFHIVHDYLAYLALRFCKNSPYLTENMRTSIDYYRDEIEGSPSAKSRVEKRNSQYMGRNRKTGKNFSDSFLRFLLFLTLAGPLFISVLMGINSYISLNYRFVLLSACCCLSTYYIYNICKYFFRSYKFLYLVTALPGMVSMYSCFRFPDWWAVAIGGELAWLGACMGFAAKPLTRKARSPFLKNCLSFISIGISVALLGLAYLFLRNSVEVDFIPLIDAVFYGVYIVFVFISITAHINVSFMYERLGLTLMRKIK